MSSETEQKEERQLARAAFVDSLRRTGLDFSEVAPSSAGGYTLTNWVRGERVLIHEQFGSYQGEWLTLSLDQKAGEYRIYKGCYGSCSGCDSWQGSEIEGLFDSWRSDTKGITATRGNELVLDWAFDYPPFLEIPRTTAANIAQNGAARFVEVMPANMRGDYSEIDMVSFSADAVAEIKLEENLAIQIADIFSTPNAELRRRLMERYGIDAVVRDANFATLDSEGDDALVAAPDGLSIGIGKECPVYMYLKDPSTERRYLLRVPPTMKRIREAKAWSFGVSENDYRPQVET